MLGQDHAKTIHSDTTKLHATHDNIVDRDMNNLDEETDETHNEESYASGARYPGELCEKVETQKIKKERTG